MDEIIKEVEKLSSILEIKGNKLKVIFFEDPDRSIKNLREALNKMGIIFKAKREDDHFVLTFAELEESKNNYLVPIVLFILTIFSTLIAGALQQGYAPWQNWKYLAKGIPFSFSIILILGIHELAHFLTSKKNGVKATFPHFIPFPNPLIGTMGAFIRIKSPIIDRKALIEIGSSGPIAGFLAAIPITIIGLMKSTITTIAEGKIMLGEPLIFKLLARFVLGEIDKSTMVILHPMAFAGWIGFFVTSLNLLPIGQLDGGHILFGSLGKKGHTIISRVLLLALLPLGFLWSGWWLWAILLIILGSRHPEPLYWEDKLSRWSYAFSIFSLIIFILSFTPIPIKVVP